MNLEDKVRGRPMPDAKMKIFTKNLEDAISLESQYITDQPILNCNFEEVSISARDRTVEVLRFLKVWFDVPQSVFFSSVSYLDQFLTKFKVKEKYLSCLCLSCFNVAVTQAGYKINPVSLIRLSQSRFSLKDMERMCDLIHAKLNLKEADHALPTALDFLKIFLDIFEWAAVKLGADYLVMQMFQRDDLTGRLAVLMGHSECAFFRPSLLSLALIQIQMERFLSHEVPNKSLYYSVEMLHLVAVVMELQRRCKIKSKDFANCHKKVSATMNDYDSHKKSQSPQHLWWRFSSMLSARMSFKYLYKLEPIIENEMS